MPQLIYKGRPSGGFYHYTISYLYYTIHTFTLFWGNLAACRRPKAHHNDRALFILEWIVRWGDHRDLFAFEKLNFLFFENDCLNRSALR